MDELKNIAPELSKLKKEVPFSTPKNYFDDFSARMQTRMQTEKQGEPEHKPKIIQLLKPFIGLAASFALIFLLVYVPLKTFITSEINEVTVNIDHSDTDSEFLNILEGIDESSFFALLDESESETTDDFTNEELMSYVSANFTDYEIFEFTKNN
ncbi:hypothetical protein OU798_20850 [Prolixibacteraceae bacterium Z1-6]|uniref:Uncharacterized protein n=1 Tax=Draconibacterium aestuarii TaxID=2998507 RepID=A0A9X3F921_9BACT|nr:hypothetical protein [Prolixibacteraceae bacterium Z1-6]